MTWEYLAGFFDGEGHISVASNGVNIRGRVVLSNTNKEVMDRVAEFVHKELNYFILEVHRDNSKSRRMSGGKPIYRISINDSGLIVVFLQKLLPYFIVKKREAELMIEYYAGIGKPVPVLTDEIRNARIEFRNNWP